MYFFITIRHARRKAIIALSAACALGVMLIVGGYVGRFTVMSVDNNPIAADDGIRLPIIMYHSVLPNGAGSPNEYQVTAAQFERDLGYLDARGYQTVVIGDLIEYANDDAELPEKAVMITFDDGHLNNLTHAVPLMERYGYRGVISVVGTFIERAEREADPSPTYAYMRWEDVREAANSGVVEIQNHSYNLHGDKGRRGFTRRAGETQAAFQSSLTEDVGKMQQLLKLHGGVEATCFSYPYGFTYANSAEMLKELGFQAAMTCRERVNYLPRDPDALFHLDRFNRSGLASTEAFMRKLGIE